MSAALVEGAEVLLHAGQSVHDGVQGSPSPAGATGVARGRGGTRGHAHRLALYLGRAALHLEWGRHSARVRGTHVGVPGLLARGVVAIAICRTGSIAPRLTRHALGHAARPASSQSVRLFHRFPFFLKQTPSIILPISSSNLSEARMLNKFLSTSIL